MGREKNSPTASAVGMHALDQYRPGLRGITGGLAKKLAIEGAINHQRIIRSNLYGMALHIGNYLQQVQLVHRVSSDMIQPG